MHFCIPAAVETIQTFCCLKCILNSERYRSLEKCSAILRSALNLLNPMNSIMNCVDKCKLLYGFNLLGLEEVGQAREIFLFTLCLASGWREERDGMKLRPGAWQGCQGEAAELRTQLLWPGISPLLYCPNIETLMNTAPNDTDGPISAH